MSVLTKTQFHTPLTGLNIERLMGVILRMQHPQAAAASASASLLGVVTQSGELRSLTVLSAAIAASGESMTIDVLKNGVSIMLGGTPFTINATTVPAGDVRKQKELKALVDPAKLSFLAGDILTVTRVYTAGGGPTPMTATVVIAEIS